MPAATAAGWAKGDGDDGAVAAVAAGGGTTVAVAGSPHHPGPSLPSPLARGGRVSPDHDDVDARAGPGAGQGWPEVRIRKEEGAEPPVSLT